MAWCNLGHTLTQQGKFKEALDAMRKGHELGSRQTDWSHPSAQWVRDAEWWLKLDTKLAAVLQGDAQPADASERVNFARVCAKTEQPAAAARFYADAFRDEPALADSLAGHRYDAACAAVRAACGDGDAANLGATARQRSQAQARAWLRDDLRAWTARLQESPRLAGHPA